jgi:hypothetical protein
MLDLIPTLSVLEIHKQWQHTVAAYAARHLKKYTDTFPALSGLAKIVYQFLDKGKGEEEYLAGLWSSNLRRSLAWHTTNTQRRVPARHPDYIEPSWSWASVNGTITYEQGIRKETDRLSVVHEPGLTATIKNWEIKLAGTNSFRPLMSAILNICAPLVDAILEPSIGSSSYYPYNPTRAQQDQRGRWIGHMAFDVHSEGEGLKVVRVFALFRNATYCEHGNRGEMPTCGVGVVVVPVQGKKGVYRRVGRVSHLWMEYFDGVEEEDIMLV